jgi:hypothetical protein
MVTEEPTFGTQVIAGPRNGLTMEIIEQNLKDLKKEDSSREASDKGQVIEGIDFDFDDKSGDPAKMLRVKPGSDGVIIRRCRFRNKKIEDPALVIADSKNVVVEDCIFEKMEGGNKREAIRIAGDGSESGAIKSVGNTIEDCFFINNDGNVTVRHGGLTTIRNNYFKGKNGVRIHGYGNHVEYNHFEDNSTTDNSRSPISLWWGDDDKDPNWDDFDKPSGKKGHTHHVYAQTVDTVIRGNEFKNCEKTIAEETKHGPKGPKNTTEENNTKL